MDSIKVKQNKTDPRSLYTYLGRASVKTVTFQHTERETNKLLDIVFEVVLDDERHCEFLIRLETPMGSIRSFIDKLRDAVKHPKPHHWDGDLFHKAVTGKTPREQMEELVR